jgi:AcrR family transcriptional regulator
MRPNRKLRRSHEERRRATRAAIMDASLRLLAESGYAKFSASRVAAMAGISRGAREHYFRTKNDLVVATLEHAMSEAVAHARSLAQDAGRSSDPVGKFLADSGHFFFSRRYRALIEIMIAGRAEPALLRLWNPLVRAARVQLNQIWTDTLAKAGHEPRAARRFIELTHYLMRGLMLVDTWLPYDVDRATVIRRWHALAPVLLESRALDGRKARRR